MKSYSEKAERKVVKRLTTRDVRMEASLSQDALNITNKTRSNPLPWRGQFSPQLIEALLKAYAPENAIVLDPFVGSGTVLYECCRLGITSLGSEINPAAATMANIYHLATLSRDDRKRLLEHLVPSLDPLFRSMSSDIGASLVGLRNTVDNHPQKIIIETLICLVDFYKRPVSPAYTHSVWKRLTALILSLPHSNKPIEVALCDARTLTLPDQCVDLVVTSPPYVNVFNYHQQYRESMEALGWDLMKIAGSEIGSNRKHRANRLLTVIQYCIDMAMVLRELRRVVKDTARIVIVVGRESKVRKTPFYNGQIIERLAIETAGFDLTLKQQRVFTNRFGQHIYEDVLHFAPSPRVDFLTVENSTRQIVLDVLGGAVSRVPGEALGDLWDAIQKVDEVKASPIFVTHDVNGKSSLQSGFTVFARK